MNEKRSKGRLLCPERSKIKVTMEKEKEKGRRRKGGDEKKAMVAFLVFIMATLVEKDNSGNVFKNPARLVTFCLFLN